MTDCAFIVVQVLTVAALLIGNVYVAIKIFERKWSFLSMKQFACMSLIVSLFIITTITTKKVPLTAVAIQTKPCIDTEIAFMKKIHVVGTIVSKNCGCE